MMVVALVVAVGKTLQCNAGIVWTALAWSLDTAAFLAHPTRLDSLLNGCPKRSYALSKGVNLGVVEPRNLLPVTRKVQTFLDSKAARCR